MRRAHEILVQIVSKVGNPFINWRDIIFICALAARWILFGRVFSALLNCCHAMAVRYFQVIFAWKSMVKSILCFYLLLVRRRWFYTKRSWNRIWLNVWLGQCSSESVHLLWTALLICRRRLSINAVFLCWRAACLASSHWTVTFVWTYAFLGRTLLRFGTLIIPSLFDKIVWVVVKSESDPDCWVFCVVLAFFFKATSSWRFLWFWRFSKWRAPVLRNLGLSVLHAPREDRKDITVNPAWVRHLALVIWPRSA